RGKPGASTERGQSMAIHDERRSSRKTPALARAATFRATLLGLALLAPLAPVARLAPRAHAAQDSVATDAGTLDEKPALDLGKRAYSPYAANDFTMRPFFGDTHLHTSFSM